MTPCGCLKGLVVLALSLASATAIASDCHHKLYTGFDSRVKARLVGRLAPGREPIVGFDVVHGVPVVALPHRLVLFRNRRTNLFVEDEIEALVSDSTGGLSVQVRDASNPARTIIKRLGQHGFQRDSTLTTDVQGRLSGSGTKLYVETINDEKQATFLARRPDGAYVVITNVKGRLRNVSWNRAGLAAVVNSTALAWPAGSKEIISLATDDGLKQTHDVCLVGRDRSVVALKESVLVLTPNGATALVGMHARCSWDGTSLYLLDENSGLIWQIHGVERLGTRIGDLAYTQELIESLPSDAPNDSRAAVEAARSIGCNEVMRMRSSAGANRAPPLQATVSALLALANQLLDQGKYEDAADAFQRVLRTNKDNANAKAGLERVRRAAAAEREIASVRSGTVGSEQQGQPGASPNRFAQENRAANNGDSHPVSPASSSPITGFYWCEGNYQTGIEPNGNQLNQEDHAIVTRVFSQTVTIGMTDVGRKFEKWMKTKAEGRNFATGSCQTEYLREAAERRMQYELAHLQDGLRHHNWATVEVVEWTPQ
jgi:tetratricopeptide (TPR) repeat protein